MALSELPDLFNCLRSNRLSHQFAINIGQRAMEGFRWLFARFLLLEQKADPTFRLLCVAEPFRYMAWEKSLYDTVSISMARKMFVLLYVRFPAPIPRPFTRKVSGIWPSESAAMAAPVGVTISPSCLVWRRVNP